MNSRNITDTDSRLLNNLTNVSQHFYDNQNVDYKISDAVTDSMITIGTVVKIYPALNKSLVRLHNGKEVFCIHNLIMGGDILFLYTPTGDRSYCDVLHEPCVIPRGKLDVIVSPFNNGTDDWLLLGYDHSKEMVGYNPSKNGQFKILCFGSLGEYSIRFGMDGLQIVNNGQIVTEEIDNWGKDVSTPHYSKEEVDGLLKAYADKIKVLEDKVELLENTLNGNTLDNTGEDGNGDAGGAGTENNGTDDTGDGTDDDAGDDGGVGDG